MENIDRDVPGQDEEKSTNHDPKTQTSASNGRSAATEYKVYTTYPEPNCHHHIVSFTSVSLSARRDTTDKVVLRRRHLVPCGCCVSMCSKLENIPARRTALFPRSGVGANQWQPDVRAAAVGTTLGAAMKPRTGVVAEKSAIMTPPTIIVNVAMWRLGLQVVVRTIPASGPLSMIVLAEQGAHARQNRYILCLPLRGKRWWVRK